MNHIRNNTYHLIQLQIQKINIWPWKENNLRGYYFSLKRIYLKYWQLMIISTRKLVSGYFNGKGWSEGSKSKRFT